MKKLIFIIALFGCSKMEMEYCYECTITTTGANYHQVDKVQQCNMTAEEAREAEISGTNTYYNMTQKTVCKKI